eukprot:TRINITY_DN10157_c0_g2_i4.p1 TRINITY_DN10157_c0_g2~~TRINITY_DN10157_c0_g2_i4.p1  ORF type:complete len:134 (+),score=16.43 TRINITY_DN10157_c0_g2_i4:488-889(+)
MSQWYCNACNVPSEGKFCGDCGGKATEVTSDLTRAESGTSCPHCRMNNKPGAKFCIQCGGNISGAPRMSAVQRGYVPPDHTGNIPVVSEVAVRRGLKAYVPPDHTANIPVVKEVADVYTGNYVTATEIRSQKR